MKSSHRKWHKSAFFRSLIKGTKMCWPSKMKIPSSISKELRYWSCLKELVVMLLCPMGNERLWFPALSIWPPSQELNSIFKDKCGLNHLAAEILHELQKCTTQRNWHENLKIPWNTFIFTKCVNNINKYYLKTYFRISVLQSQRLKEYFVGKVEAQQTLSDIWLNKEECTSTTKLAKKLYLPKEMLKNVKRHNTGIFTWMSLPSLSWCLSLLCSKVPYSCTLSCVHI